METSFKTKDGYSVLYIRTRHNPNYPESFGGMAPCMDYPWVKLPNREWIKINARSQMELKAAVERNILEDLEFFIGQGLI